MSSSISDLYITSAPGPQNALDIFHGEWSSRLPEPYARLNAGNISLFEDPRITWALTQLGDVTGQHALELGPLEGAHTYMLHRAGCASIAAIESNTRAYLKCLIIKELFNLTQAHFLCGDFVSYLRSSPPHVDVVFASGVLYHMTNPAELIELISRVCDRVFIWTHYYDPDIISRQPKRAAKFSAATPAQHAGFAHHLYRQQYEAEVLAWHGFCGGSKPHSHWMSRADILACLKHFGLPLIQLAFEEPGHPNGPAFALLASRR